MSSVILSLYIAINDIDPREDNHHVKEGIQKINEHIFKKKKLPVQPDSLRPVTRRYFPPPCGMRRRRRAESECRS